MTAAQLQRCLTGYLQHYGAADNLVLPNVFVNNWESDLARVTPRYYWTEYEIKISRSDFKADFRKSIQRYDGMNISKFKKHDIYQGPKPWEREQRRQHNTPATVLAVPKQFFFVTPKGLLDVSDIPAHAGLMEIEKPDTYSVETVKKAPQLKASRQLTTTEVFKLCVKANWRSYHIDRNKA